ncbi:amidohydrolase [Rhizohabitans arisaemae]|uniref:amidohydrolase n=1 Tax=Rhizohabitans arisaemae TaxID=2720610 RepID=UPI0024B0C865|nr:amidohydrolase [Rhizohabitans arisaemae]
MARTVIRGGAVLTMGPPGFLRGDVAVEGNRIAEVGRVSPGKADVEIDASGCWVLPGFVQTHVHLCQTLFRGLAEDLDVMEWLDRWIWPLEQALDREATAASARWGIAQLLLSGTTAFNAMETARHTDAVFEAAADLGARAVVGKALMDRREPGTDLLGETTDEALADLTRLVDRWHGAADGRLRASVAPRAPSSATERMWRDGLELARRRRLVVHTHVNENRGQAELVSDFNGGRDVEVLDGLGALGPRTVLAHCVWLTDQEMSLLAWSGTNVAHCPTANLKLGSGVAPVPELLARGVNVGIGTDGAACNNSLDALDEMRMAALVHRPRSGAGAMGAQRALTLGTVAGARALGLDAGTVEVGRLADIVVMRTPEAGHLHETADPATHVVFAPDRRVTAVLVDGRVVVEDGELVHGCLRDIERDAFAARRRVVERMRERRAVRQAG